MTVAHDISISFHAPLIGVLPSAAGKPSDRTQPSADDPAEQKRIKEEQAAVQRVLAGLGQAARSLTEQEQRHRNELPRAVVELAVAVASRLVHEKLKTGEFAVEELVRQAVDRLG